MFLERNYKLKVFLFIRDFQKDDNLEEIPFPAGRLTVAETAFLANTARDMGFDCRRKTQVIYINICVNM